LQGPCHDLIRNKKEEGCGASSDASLQPLIIIYIWIKTSLRAALHWRNNRKPNLHTTNIRLCAADT